MEQPRRRFLTLSALGLVAAAGVGWALLESGEREPFREPAALAGAERVVVEVLNGTGKRGLARVATRVLRQAGFDVVYFGTAGAPVALTQALARRGDSAAAARVASALGATRVGVATDTLLRVDVTVLLGDDYRPPPGIRP
ncbi:MAG TPA: LytR C-terminal domain-containing protein [Gemmatimonadales bacterium]|nr:LytR C-terminal domain-containing protein [Gemmatimonadales bacterium]